MKRCKSVFTVAACAALASCTAWGIMNEVRGFRAPLGGAKEAVEGFLWLEAESFADYGEWRLDTQFTHKMGSAYLLAAGVLKPLKPATTSVGSFPQARRRSLLRTLSSRAGR